MNDSEHRKKERKGEKGGKEERTQIKKLEFEERKIRDWDRRKVENTIKLYTNRVGRVVLV